jgi:AcrR family transcriptional regulator
MTDKTEQKILDAALKIFSEEGFKGATTRVIAHESGFSELTLFRKFETKENLFNSVLIKNRESILEELDSMLIDTKFENNKEFLETLIKNLANLTENNFEFVHILVYNRRETAGNILMEIITHISQYVERVSPNGYVDSKVFVLNIFSFVYFVVFDKNRRGFFDCDEAIDEFIDHSVKCCNIS